MNSRKIFVAIFFVMIMLVAAGCQAAGPSSPAATSRPTAELAAAGATPGAPAGEARPSPSPTQAMTPTATPSPTSTPAPTATATPTATPIPTLPPEQVGGLSGVPDPHQSNPDLFDLTDPDAPIPQFVHAFTEAGIDIQDEDVANNLEFATIEDKDGNPVIVATTKVDKFSGKYADVNGDYPLFIATQNEKGEWRWRRAWVKDLATFEVGDSLVYKMSQKTGFRVVSSQYYHDLLAKNYSVITLAQGTYWKWFERTKGGPIDPYSKKDLIAQIAILKGMKKLNPSLRIRVAPFGSFPEQNPEWLNGLSKEEAKMRIKKHMQQLYDLLTENGIIPDEYVVVNEPFFQGSGWTRQDSLYDIFSGYGYIVYAFAIARKIVGEKVILIYNDTANNSKHQYPYNLYTDLTKQNVELLSKAGIDNFAVGMQMHLLGNYPIDENDLVRTMQEYGVPVYITELDVDVSMLSPQDRSKALVDIYTSVFRAALKSGVCKGISTWNGVDDFSNPVDYLGRKGASPTLFSGSTNPRPKLVYYVVLKELLSNLNGRASSQ